MDLKRFGVLSVVTVLTWGFTSLGLVANAAPTGPKCAITSVDRSRASATCPPTAPRHRIVATCTQRDPNGRRTSSATKGPWVTGAQPAELNCGAGHHVNTHVEY
ncbi:hypothetical protein [Pseudonocardia spinosispora]|uniref:hypothetical protein n=1 Tax=Pseudonocardia spinosispora TaxID=103441 RepID=UPI0004208588|nr:hypothetical protein [Pseudonocardia spinosispora]